MTAVVEYGGRRRLRESAHDDRNRRRRRRDALIRDEIDDHEDEEHDNGQSEDRGGGQDAGGRREGSLWLVAHCPHPRWSMGPRPRPSFQSAALVSVATPSATMSSWVFTSPTSMPQRMAASRRFGVTTSANCSSAER